MGFRFQRRIRLGGGWGLNASGSGASLSHRSRHGSVGTRGFSLRTGIPGLSFRQSWGKNSGAMAVLVLCFVALAAIVKVLLHLLPLLWQCLAWVVLTVHDLCRYGIQRVAALRTR